MGNELNEQLRSIDNIIMQKRAEIAALDKQIDIERSKTILSHLGERRYRLSVEVSGLRGRKDAMVRRAVSATNAQLKELYN